MTTDTIAAPITPLVNAPIIALRISGKDALKVFSLLKTGGNTGGEPVHAVMKRYVFCGKNPVATDDVMAVYFKAPNSYTGEDTAEIYFHGNPITVRAALKEIYALGIRPAQRGEFSKRAFLNGKIDLTQAEAVQELIGAKTEATAFNAYRQLKGVVKSHLDEMKNALLDVKALIEAKLDFPDEDTGSDEIEYIRTEISKVLDWCSKTVEGYSALSRHNKGISVVIAGKPNVGKSSLMNALLKEDRAIVSSIAGTTRDFIAEDLYIGAVPVQVIDTAGVRVSGDLIEAEGVKRSEDKIKSADLVLVVVDLSSIMDGDDAKILELTKDTPRIIVGNKMDKCLGEVAVPCHVAVSAATGKNIDRLIDLIKEKSALADGFHISTTVSVTERHGFLLTEAAEILKTIIDNVELNPLDMTAMDLDRCVDIFKEITGEKYTEDILDRIFSRFCIGK